MKHALSISILLSLACVFLCGFQGRSEVIVARRRVPPASNPTVVQSGACLTTTATCSVTFGSPVGAGHYLLCYEGGTGNGTGATCTMVGETITHQTGASKCSNATGAEGDCYVQTRLAAKR